MTIKEFIKWCTENNVDLENEKLTIETYDYDGYTTIFELEKENLVFVNKNLRIDAKESILCYNSLSKRV